MTKTSKTNCEICKVHAPVGDGRLVVCGCCKHEIDTVREFTSEPWTGSCVEVGPPMREGETYKTFSWLGGPSYYLTSLGRLIKPDDHLVITPSEAVDKNYRSYQLNIGPKKRSLVRISVLMASVYLDGYILGDGVEFKDGNPDNYSVENLKIVRKK